MWKYFQFLNWKCRKPCFVGKICMKRKRRCKESQGKGTIFNLATCGNESSPLTPRKFPLQLLFSCYATKQTALFLWQQIRNIMESCCVLLHLWKLLGSHYFLKCRQRLIVDLSECRLCLCVSNQADWEAAAQWRNHWVISRGTSWTGGGEGAAGGGLYLLWFAQAVHHRHPVGPGILHLFWHKV